MPTPLLTALPLLLSPASAKPPVDTQRVTGNVSTEHSSRARPVVDACRVTGNIMRQNVKSGNECHIAPPTPEEEPIHLLRVGFVMKGKQCHLDGTVVQVDATAVCKIEVDHTTYHYPEARFSRVTPEGS